MRSVVLYGVLVGLPIAGTAAVMKYGRDLDSAPAVAGAWTVDTTARVSTTNCSPATAIRQTGSITISQAGPRVWLTVTGQPGVLIQGLVTRMPGPAPAHAAVEGTGDGIVFRATIDRGVQPRRLEGEFQFSGYGAAGRLPLSATLAPPGEKS